MKASISKDCTWQVEGRCGTVWEEALESERGGPENKEAYFNRRKQIWGCVHLKKVCCSSCTSSWVGTSHWFKRAVRPLHHHTTDKMACGDLKGYKGYRFYRLSHQSKSATARVTRGLAYSPRLWLIGCW
eukprot:1157786-Pelagomonas_calceolata.AAC.1